MIGVYEETITTLERSGVDSQHAGTEEKHKSDWLATVSGSDDPRHTCLHNAEKDGQ